MNYTLNDLTQLHESRNHKEEQAKEDRHAYIHGKQGLHTCHPDHLSEAFSERYRDCYRMGYNYAEWRQDNG